MDCNEAMRLIPISLLQQVDQSRACVDFMREAKDVIATFSTILLVTRLGWPA